MLNRIRKDYAASITTMGIFMVLIILVTGTLILDITKNFYIKERYANATMRAAQHAVSYQLPSRGLSPEGSVAAIREYYLHTRPHLVNDTDFKKMTLEDAAFRGSKCERGQYPKIKVSNLLPEKKGSKRGNLKPELFIMTSKGVNANLPIANKTYKFTQNQMNLFKTKRYVGVRVEVEDVTTNFLMGMFGHPCSTFKTVSTVTTSGGYDEGWFDNSLK